MSPQLEKATGAAYMCGGKVRGEAEEGSQAWGQAVEHILCQLLLHSILRTLHPGPVNERMNGWMDGWMD